MLTPVKCSNEKMDDGSGWTPKYTKTETLVEWRYKKIYEAERSKGRRSTRLENIEIENSMRRPSIGKCQRRRGYIGETWASYYNFHSNSIFHEHMQARDFFGRDRVI